MEKDDLKEFFGIPFYLEEMEEMGAYYRSRPPKIAHKRTNFVSEAYLVHEFFHHCWFNVLDKKDRKEFAKDYKQFYKDNKDSDLFYRISAYSNNEEPEEGFAIIGESAYTLYKHMGKLSIPPNLQKFYGDVITDTVFSLSSVEDFK